jgi:RNA recognition motif-containing protein
MTNIFIANLDWEITSEDLKATFSAFGTVTYAHVVYDRETKKSNGYGYVEMDNADEAIAAIQALKGLEVNGRELDVKIASPKGNRPAPKPPVEKKKPFVKREPSSYQKREPSSYLKRESPAESARRPRTRVSGSSEAQKVERKPFNRED